MGKAVVSLFLIIAMLACGCSDISSSTNQEPTAPSVLTVSTKVNPIPTTIANPIHTKMATIKKIVEDYYKTHTYSLPDLYVCGDMSCDVWDILKTEGITAKIQVGNVDEDISDIKDANHAWVLAEITPDSWIALETTGGFLVCDDRKYCASNNTRYYRGWSFDSPREYKEFVEKLKHPCEEGYVLGMDNLCHQACGGGSYCTGNSVCVNGKCMGCDEGYILGSDMKCHKPCGSSTTYCSGDSVCVDGECRSCESGYILGSDMKCHQPCGSTTSYCPGDSVCMNGKCYG